MVAAFLLVLLPLVQQPDAAAASRALVSEQAKYGAYFRGTCAAEERLLAGEPAAALAAYEKVFAGVEFRFARDVCIAAQVAAHLQDETKTAVLVEACVLAGVPLEFACGGAVFAAFRDGDGHRRLAAKERDLLQRYEARIDQPLRAETERRFRLEQQKKSGDRDAYFAVVDDNVKWITAQLERGAFPGEMRIGIDPIVPVAQARPWQARCSYAATMVAPTLKHFPYAFDVLKEPLLRAAGDGLIDPRELATVFVFAKHRVCIWRPGVPDSVKERIEDSPLRDVIFRAPFEKEAASIEVANRHRVEWLLPRLGGKYDVAGLRAATGIDVSIGNSFD